MDETTESILERTRQRRKQLDQEIMRSASISPKCSTVGTGNGCKRKSSERTDALALSENSPTIKRPSFDENDKARNPPPEKPTRKSLYPTEQLEELRTSGSQLPSPLSSVEPEPDDAAVLRAANRDDDVVLRPSAPDARKARFAALSAQLEDFEVDMKHCQSPCSRPKSEFMRGPAPRPFDSPSARQMSPAKSQSPMQHVSPDKQTPETNKAPTKALRFADPVAAVQMSFASEDSSILTNDPVASEPTEEKDDTVTREDTESSSADECGLEAFCRRKKQSPKSLSNRNSPARQRDDAVSAVLDTVKMTVEESEQVEANANKKTNDMASYWETRIQKDAQTPDAKVFWESEINAQKKAQQGIPRTPQSTPKAPPLPKGGVVQTKPSFRPSPVINKPVGKPVEEHQDLRRLRNRWELSSATGTPLHPERGSEELIEAAVRLAADMRPAKVGPKIWQKQQALFGKASPLARAQEVVTTVKQPEPESVSAEQNETPEEVTEADTSQESGSAADADVSSSSDAGEVETAEENMDEFIDEVFEAVELDKTESDAGEDDYESPDQSLDGQEDNATPKELLHSVSFYRNQQRKQRASSSATPVTVNCCPPSVTKTVSSSSVRKDNRVRYEKQINLLNREVNVQQEQIAQASRALNYCRTTEEFRGSREEVDAQRALLLATEKRRALVTELDRVGRCLTERRPLHSDSPLGTLTISHITVPLKREFVNENYSHHGDLLYYFICLLKHRDNVFATQMVTTDEGLRSGSLHFQHYMQLSNLEPDFIVSLEIYALRTKREIYSHEEKYRIKGATLKTKSKSSALYSPGLISPGGPVAVLDPSFQQIGRLELSLRSVNRGKFRFDGVQFSSPIEGGVFVKLRCCADSAGQVEERGFLSMYEEVSNLGCWTRLWTVLKDGELRFWRYPDDETSKDPLMALDLSQCISSSVIVTPRNDCARPNTLHVDLAPDTREQSHISRKVSRAMLSADSKDDFCVWCAAIDATLRNLHVWNPDFAKAQKNV